MHDIWKDLARCCRENDARGEMLDRAYNSSARPHDCRSASSNERCQNWN